MLFDDFEHDFGVEVFDALYSRDGFVDWDGADGHGRVAKNGFANFVDVAAGGEVHDGVGAVVDGGVELFEFFVDFGRDGRVADVGVDFAEAGHADGHGLEFGMVDVGGDDHAAAGDFVADEFGRELFFVGDEAHFFRDRRPGGRSASARSCRWCFLFCGGPATRRGVGGRCILLPLLLLPFPLPLVEVMIGRLLFVNPIITAFGCDGPGLWNRD